MVDNDDSFIEEVDRELLEQDLQVSAAQPREDDYRLDSHIRDNIANEMWQHYVNNQFYAINCNLNFSYSIWL